MTQKQLVIRPVSWRAVALQILAMAALIAVVHLILRPENGFLSMLIGAVIFLILSNGSRYFLLRDHRRAMKLLRARQFRQAIPVFWQSYNFFSRYPWLDDYRAITMLNSAEFGCREMALNNIGYAYVQLEDANNAKAAYEWLLAEFPDSPLAQSAMQTIKTFSKLSSSKR
jgi:hypothetical protein